MKTMTFRRYDGTIVTLGPGWTSPDYRVRLLSESDEFIHLQDAQGSVSSIAKGVFRSNHEQVPTQSFDLDPSLHHHYFGKPSEARKRDLDSRLLRQLTPILEHEELKELIIQTPEYYLIRPFWLQSSMAYGGSCRATLGAMLQAWSSSKKLRYSDVEAHRFSNLYRTETKPGGELATSSPSPQRVSKCKLMHINGSPLSGMHAAMGWCMDTKEVYFIRTGKDGGRLPGTVLENFRKVWEVAVSVDATLENELLAMESLIYTLETRHPS